MFDELMDVWLTRLVYIEGTSWRVDGFIHPRIASKFSFQSPIGSPENMLTDRSEIIAFRYVRWLDLTHL